MVLINCGHSLCFQCEIKLPAKKCPNCNSNIESTLTNWELLKLVAESEYDKLKSELDKNINEIVSIRTKIQTDEEQRIKENSNQVSSIKTRVETQTKELIRQINESKFQLFKELDAANRLESRIGSCNKILLNFDKLREAATKNMANNQLSKEQLANLNAKLLKQKKELKIVVPAQENVRARDSFDFIVNKSAVIDSKFIGQIKKVYFIVFFYYI